MRSIALLLLASLCFVPQGVRADEDAEKERQKKYRTNRVIIREKIVPIRGFNLDESHEEIEEEPPLLKRRIRVIITGTYVGSAAGWNLYQDRVPVEVDPKTGKLSLSLSLTGLDNTTQIEARGPLGESEQETIRVTVSRYEPAPAPRILTFHPFYSFRVFPVYIFQKFGGFSFATGVSWNPTEFLNKALRFSGQVGFYVPNAITEGFFVVLDTEVFIGYRFLPRFELEVGGGAQTWVNYSGMVPTASVSLSFMFQKVLFNMALANRIFVGYSIIPAENLTHNIRLGLGFVF
jgi:hypothetical protein